MDSFLVTTICWGNYCLDKAEGKMASTPKLSLSKAKEHNALLKTIFDMLWALFTDMCRGKS